MTNYNQTITINMHIDGRLKPIKFFAGSAKVVEDITRVFGYVVEMESTSCMRWIMDRFDCKQAADRYAAELNARTA